MGPKHFRRLALAMKDAVEGAHMGHADFRVNNRIFATLHADDQFGMVKLAPDQQRRFTHEYPEAFTPENGAWGRAGCTKVRLESAHEDVLGEALTLAWQNCVNHAKPSKPKRPRARVRRSGKHRTKT